MSYARIEIVFTRFSDPGKEYLLRTLIDPTYSQPDAVDFCLVVKKGDSTAVEELMRVASFAEFITTPLEALPTTVDVFSSPSLAAAAPQVGDVIKVNSPLMWRQFFFALVQTEVVVTSVTSPTEVVVTPAFPAFGRELTFEVWRGASLILPAAIPYVYPTDGVATRDYTGLTGIEFLANSHVDNWDDYTVANNRLTSIKNGASSLMSALNAAEWAGTEEVTYP